MPPRRIYVKWQKAFRRLSHMVAFLSETQRHVSVRRITKTPDYAEVELWGKNFRSLMKHPAGRRIFKKYLVSEHAEENMLFWEAVEIYKNLKEADKRKELAKDIYEEFISPNNAKTEISLDSKNRDRVRPLIESDAPSSQFVPNFFDSSQLHIYKLMESDTWRRFVLSGLYREHLISKVTTETVDSWKTRFPKLLQHSIGRSLLAEFLALEHADENIRFWEDVQTYKSIKTIADRKTMANKIYTRFVSPSADTEISLDYKTKIKVEKRLNEGESDLFDGAEQHITLLMARDSFPRFVRSQYFAKFIQQHEKLTAPKPEPQPQSSEEA